MAGVWLLLLLDEGVVVAAVVEVLVVGGGGDRGQLVVPVALLAMASGGGCKGGLEDLRTRVCELELELEEEEAEEDEAEDDDDDDVEDEEEQLAAPDIRAEAAEVIGKLPTTCMGCGGGDSGELWAKRLRGVATGGGDSGISTMGLGERLGTNSD